VLAKYQIYVCETIRKSPVIFARAEPIISLIINLWVNWLQ